MTKLKRVAFLFALIVAQNLAFAGGSDGSGPILGADPKLLVIDALNDAGQMMTGGSTLTIGHLVTIFCSINGDSRYPQVDQSLTQFGCDCQSIALRGVTECDQRVENAYP